MRKWWVELFTIEQCRVAHKQINRTLRQQHNMMMYSHEWCLADLWEEGQPKRLRCRTKRASPNKKKRKTTQSKLMRSDVLTQTISPHELTFAFLAKADGSPGATTQGRAQMSIWISVECACLRACTRAAITQKKSTKRLLHLLQNQPPNRVRVCTSENSKCTYVRFLSLQS